MNKIFFPLRLPPQNLLIFLCGIVAAGTACIAGLLSKSVIALAIFLSGTTFMTVFLGWLYPDLFILFFIINFSGLLSAGIPANTQESIARLYLVLLGTLIALLIKNLCWPGRLKKNIKRYMRASLKSLNQLQQILFTSYLERNYLEKHYWYEKKLHQKNQYFLYLMKKLRSLLAKSNEKKFHELMEHINHCYHILMAIGSLRYRVSDPTTFEIIALELKSISIGLTAYLNNLIAGMEPISFYAAIEALEEINLRILQTAATEPMAFAFFIQQLYSLHAQLELIRWKTTC